MHVSENLLQQPRHGPSDDTVRRVMGIYDVIAIVVLHTFTQQRALKFDQDYAFKDERRPTMLCEDQRRVERWAEGEGAEAGENKKERKERHNGWTARCFC